ncbi:MAG TPA: preprotein translocase subunit SecA [Kiritimatiellia bacterium]|nr:preprotein translocase subunit SecA [Kiritimatiellia bacterium]HMP34160.1 preprotein translocase subunit SecA [Kiritimatiellia bacterium]
MQWLLRKIVGTKNDRDVKRMRPLVARINELEVGLQSLSDEALKAKTGEFRKRLAEGQTLADLELEAFAVVKNACRRLCGTVATVCDHTLTWEMVPFDVQLIGGLALHYGKIAEMATGEGKTLVATMPAYLNALTGRGVHVVTVNDYLARRDSEWMGLVYKFLGLTVGCIQSQMDPATRRVQYACDITYGTNSEFGFDYLRDMGMAFRPEDQVQRGHTYAIIDEIDSILIDEARTPLIISGPAPYSTAQYIELKPLVERLYRKQRELCNTLVTQAKELIEKGDNDEAMRKLYQVHQGMPKHPQMQRLLEDASVRRLLEKIESMMLTEMHKEEGRALREELYFVIEEKHHDASLTEKGCEALSPNDPDAYLLPDIVSAMSELDGNAGLTEEQKFEKRQEIQNAFANRSERIHAVDQLIRAYSLYERDVQYVVQDNQVVIVDENTGRLMSGRRWSDGLHQAVEAKEGVKIERETQTLATITIQNYFRLYKKLSGMTGTAETEADEFHQIYKLDVMVIPTNRPVRRLDYNDFIYKTQREKYNAIIQEISECHQRGQPVLVGTISVEASELVSRMLRRQNIPHNVLNAKNHQREADIVANAGQPGAVTIATNMAGRGTDIKLGPGVVHIARDVITSGASLATKIEGKTLRDILLDKPAGLHVIGSERHESRRIDRQLRGRCARQGDPGSSRFYVSLEDDLMRIFGSDRISKLMDKLGIEEGEVMEHKWLNKSIERAQRRVEQHNFSIRKRTLDYDDVMNKQREIIYGFRSEILQAEEVSPHLLDIAGDVIAAQAELVREEDEDSLKVFIEWVNTKFPVGLKRDHLKDVALTPDALTDHVLGRVKEAYGIKVKVEDPDRLKSMERYIVLNAIDTHWQEYLRSMDALRQGVGLRAYGQRDPLVEYKKEAYTMFSDLMDKIKADVSDRMFRAATSVNAFQSFLSALPRIQTQHASVAALGGSTSAQPVAGAAAGGGAAPAAPAARPQSQQEAAMEAALSRKAAPVRRDMPKVGRNDPCPCGSGKKYKNCHGANG